MKLKLNSSAQTMELAQQVADLLQSGDVLVLNGDLGAGKTTFTKGLAEGLGVTDVIKSPTFTIIREYTSGRLPLYHMDVYRLENGGGEDLGLDEYFDGDGVSVIEWAQFIEPLIPADHLSVNFRRTNVENEREIEIIAHGERFKQLVEELENGD